ncbi:hypothetical protein ACLK2F_11175 [Escherichia coli]
MAWMDDADSNSERSVNHPVAGITVNFTMPQDVAANFTLENNGIAITQAKMGKRMSR